ncbi:MAG TPA: hypothetical protein VFA07_14225 [Chthonomonadaceae bacterium]|nr:hypothetical protein [Chthonomonadaceae bacterium]
MPLQWDSPFLGGRGADPGGQPCFRHRFCRSQRLFLPNKECFHGYSAGHENVPRPLLSQRRLSVSPRCVVSAQEPPALSSTDRIRLAEAFRLADQLEDRIWKGWSRAPFAVLLVTPQTEFLLRHPHPTADFTALGYDPLLKSNVYYRKRVFPTAVLATFPAVDGVPTIVAGQAESTTSKTSTPWVVTLLHEHFHQWQDSQPGYYAGVKALGLAHGDETGMWMLNYAFPYDSPEVEARFTEMSHALLAALQAEKTSQFADRVSAFQEARRQFEDSLAPDDRKYLSFQLWQEGVARYTEVRFAHLAVTRARPSRAFQALPDYTSFEKVADDWQRTILADLANMDLKKERRLVVYSLGAAEALLLDRSAPGWQRHYFSEPFQLDSYFPH